MSYLMETPSEGVRLRAKTDRELVAEELRLTGLDPGMSALDAGCASGAVSEAMAERVGPSGQVVGVDLSTSRVREAQTLLRGRAQVAAARVEALPFRGGTFDYSLCRLVLEYVSEPMPLVRELLRVTAPGGRAVLVDVDGYFAWHLPLDEARAGSVAALQRVLSASGFDPFVGRKLFGLLRDAGARDVRVQLRPYHLIAGAPDPRTAANWEYKLAALAPVAGRLLGAAAWAEHAARLTDLVRDPATLTYSVLFLADGRPP